LTKQIQKYIFQHLRRIWGWDPARKAAKARALAGKDKSGNHLFRCEQCNAQPLARTEVEIDHIVSVMPPTGWDEDWTGYINRMFCPAEGLRVLCKPCHRPKSNAENESRRKARKAKK
jgi:hypothetical protein